MSTPGFVPRQDKDLTDRVIKIERRIRDIQQNVAGATSANGGVPLSSATPQSVGTANPGAVTSSSRADHVHASSLAVQQDVTVSAPAAGHSLVYTGTAWANIAQAVPNLASITGPLYTNRIVINGADNLLYRYDGTAWVVLAGHTVGGQYRTSVPPAINTVETALVSTNAISLDRNSLYKVTFQVLGDISVVTANDFDMRIRETSVTGTIVKEKVIPANANAYPVGDTVAHWYATSAAESKTWVGTIQRITGTGNFAPRVGTSIQVEKVGDLTTMSTV